MRTTYTIHANPPGFQASVIETEGRETMLRLVKTLEKAGWEVKGVACREETTNYKCLFPADLKKMRRKS